MGKSRHQFEDPGSKQTLSDGLAEYFASNPDLKRDSQLIAEVANQFFKGHDTVHVVYGCGTSMPDEAIVKIVSLFGTTEGFAVLRGYVHHETLDIYRNLPFVSILAAIFLSPFLLIRALLICLRQTKRWPWLEHQKYMNAPLCRIREEFGIKIAHAKQNRAA